MKCNSYVLWVEARRKGSGAPYQKVKQTVSWWGTRDLGIRADSAAMTSDEYLSRGFVLCDGNVIASVRAEDEPQWGYSSAALKVDYKCDKCGQDFFNELPTEPEDVSAFLTRAIADFDPAAARAKCLADREKMFVYND